MDEQVAAWNKADLQGFMRGYWTSFLNKLLSNNQIRKSTDGFEVRWRTGDFNYPRERVELEQSASSLFADGRNSVVH